MFGVGGSIPDTAGQTTAPEVKITSQPVISQSVDKEGLFASWVSLVYILYNACHSVAGGLIREGRWWETIYLHPYQTRPPATKATQNSNWWLGLFFNWEGVADSKRVTYSFLRTSASRWHCLCFKWSEPKTLKLENLKVFFTIYVYESTVKLR